jgi:hypothetical protein
VIEIDLTTLIAALSGAVTIVGGVIGALWKTSQIAQAKVAAQLTQELELERAENLRLHGKISELYEQRLGESQKAIREMLEFMAGGRRANEESAKTLDALRSLIERKLT